MTATQIFSPKQYWRITVNTPNGKKSYWASDYRRNGDGFTFRVVDREGSFADKIVAGRGFDMASVKPARLNLFFAMMELEK